MINYNKFFKNRFDLVIRYYIFKRVNFGIDESYLDAISNKYDDIKRVSGLLLKRDMKNPRIYKKTKHVNKIQYGYHVMEKLFLPWNLFWIEKQIITSEKWIKDNPYPIKINGLGMAQKRFILTLKHNKSLYWYFEEKDDYEVLALWNENNYKKLLKDKTWNKLKKSKNKMIDKMTILNFFSKNTYVGDKKLYEKHIRNL